MNEQLETFTITVSQNKDKDILGERNLWTTEQLVRALLEKGSLLIISSIIAHPLGKSK